MKLWDAKRLLTTSSYDGNAALLDTSRSFSLTCHCLQLFSSNVEADGIESEMESVYLRYWASKKVETPSLPITVLCLTIMLLRISRQRSICLESTIRVQPFWFPDSKSFNQRRSIFAAVVGLHQRRQSFNWHHESAAVPKELSVPYQLHIFTFR